MTEWQDNLKKKYPLTLSHLGYFECDEGWSSILDDLCSVIENHLKHQKIEEHYAVQVKEKFGGLRFYMSSYDEFIEGAITLAEKQSVHICEVCGNSGKTENLKGWSKTLCLEHLNQLKKDDR
jgi:hypothetical protein